MNVSRFSPVALALVAALGTGCELLTSLDQNQITTSASSSSSGGGSGGEGGMMGSSSSSVSSSSTGMVECMAPNECPGADTDCTKRTCVAGVCGTMFVDAGTALPAAKQMTGDCKLAVCDGAGAETTQADNDPLDDGNDCTDDTCSAGSPSNDPSAAGASCSMNNGKVCDGAKNCVACNVTADCTTGTCVQHVCVPMDCLDLIKNNVETDVDCGGGTCPTCADGKICNSGTDCSSAVCTGNICQTATCNDGADNGQETDVDCGGPTCPKCATGDGCSVGTDCVGGSCSGSVCLPTCTDTLKNNAETDVDCGGGTCPTCANGKLCGANADCASGVCTGGVCQAPMCNDGVKNGVESDVDCGGTCPADCAPGKMCGGNADCTSSVCTGGVCQAPLCNDSTKNGSETDVDCGGGTCGACANGKDCSGNADCSSGSCQAGVCAAVACTNMIKDGLETDVDCGGASCPGCPAGKICGVNLDCQSHVCTAGLCQMASCTDNTLNGSETDVDCGGSCPLDCDDGEGCLLGTDCVSGVCNGVTCQAPACNDLVKNGLESDVDCGGGACIGCVAGDDCFANADCLSGVCTGQKCQAPACNDGVKNGTESDVDCGGACAADCVPGQLCGGNADCTTGVCSGGVCQNATCMDGVKNAVETDIDCGGGTCPVCGDGKLCSINSDCSSLNCSGGTCATASCTDGIKNGSETQVDCGGTCPACPAVSSTTPADGANGPSPVSTTTLAINFNTAMQIGTLTVQTVPGTCSGSVQISTDNFVTCIGISSAVLSPDNKTLTLTPAPGLSSGTTYFVKVAGSALAIGGNSLTPYQSATGITTSTASIAGAQVVISQAYGGGGNSGATYKNDFIELHNRGVVPISLAGWSVQYAGTGASATWTSTNLTGTIPAGGYYLIQEVAGAGGTTNLPTPDDIGTIPMGGTGGKVALVSNTTVLAAGCATSAAVVDTVGWGASTCFEGTAAAPATANTTATLRSGAGCTDTNQNGSDFTTVAPTPRNSSSTPLAYCSSTMNESNNVLEADYCVLQYPTVLPDPAGSPTVTAGSPTDLVYGRIFESGVTTNTGADPSVKAQVGYGPLDVNPENQSGWTWTDATFNVQVGNDDEYQASFTAPAAGVYRYTYRMSLDNGTTWTYCDTNGAGSNLGLSFEVTKLPVMTVTP